MKQKSLLQNQETICGYCGSSTGHRKDCPIYLGKFINAQPPNIYAGEENKPIKEELK